MAAAAAPMRMTTPSKTQTLNKVAPNQNRPVIGQIEVHIGSRVGSQLAIASK